MLLAKGAVVLDISDKEEHDADYIEGLINIRRGKLEMLVEGKVSERFFVTVMYLIGGFIGGYA